MIHFNSRLYFTLSAVFIGGAIIAFLLFTRIHAMATALLIGYFYVFSAAISIYLVHRFVAGKLTIFSMWQQWILKSFLYMITVSFAYLLGLVFQTLVLMPLETIERLISDKVWAGFVALMSLPLDQSLTDVIFASGEQSLIVSIMIVFIFIGIISLFGALVEIKWQENRSREIHNRAELAALKAQIEPHFLFNSLNTIAAYIQENPPEAEKLTLQLSKIMQYMTYSANRELVDLKEEIEFTRNYINMLEIRFKELLIVKWSTDYSSPAVQVPVLIMQPLIENSIRHGWVDRNRKLQITIRITENKPFIIIEVKDNGLGVRPELLKKLPKPGHALANIAERMQLIFGKPDLLTISSVFHKETIVKLKIPR